MPDLKPNSPNIITFIRWQLVLGSTVWLNEHVFVTSSRSMLHGHLLVMDD